MLLQLGQQRADATSPEGEEVLARIWREDGCLRIPRCRADDLRLGSGEPARRLVRNTEPWAVLGSPQVSSGGRGDAVDVACRRVQGYVPA